jgi:hypothetical protein
MMNRNVALRAAAACALVASVGCTRSTDFSITKTFDPVNSSGGTVYTYTQDVDMAAEAGSAWNHRDKVKSLDLVGIDATMTANHSGVATTGSGSIVLKRTGLADVTVGTWTNHPIPVTAPDSIGVTLQPEGVSLIMDALKNDGKFELGLTGTTADPLSFAADVTLHLHMTFKVP